MTDFTTAELGAIETGGRRTWAATGAQLNALMQPLNPNRVATREQGRTKLSYLEAWDIKRMLTRIFGFGSWSADVIDGKVLKIIEVDEPVFEWDNSTRKYSTTPKRDSDGNVITKHMFTVLAQCTMRLTLHESGATYTETAAASQKGPDIGEVTDFALKTAESDALKRAAINLGTQFGLSLYDNGSTEDVVGRVMEDGQRETIQKYREKLIEDQKAQQAAIAGGAPVGGAPSAADQQPMATADYSQGDPNAGDQLGAPAGSGRGAVAGAFQRGRAQGGANA